MENIKKMIEEIELGKVSGGKFAGTKFNVGFSFTVGPADDYTKYTILKVYSMENMYLVLREDYVNNVLTSSENREYHNSVLCSLYEIANK